MDPIFKRFVIYLYYDILRLKKVLKIMSLHQFNIYDPINLYQLDIIYNITIVIFMINIIIIIILIMYI